MNPQKLYSNNDMVKVGCHDCKGCSDCCQDMGQSIWIDPYDTYQLTKNIGKTFEELLVRELELHVEDGLILPNIRMAGEGTPKCSFLNEEDRCSVHGFRPGFCRLFPLGRNYEEGKLMYFLLEGACPMSNKSKVKVNKWLNVPRIKDYEDFLIKWHTLTKGLRYFYAENPENEAAMKAINMQFLQIFYLTPYSDEDFYPQFKDRMSKMNAMLHSLNIFVQFTENNKCDRMFHYVNKKNFEIKLFWKEEKEIK